MYIVNKLQFCKQTHFWFSFYLKKPVRKIRFFRFLEQAVLIKKHTLKFFNFEKKPHPLHTTRVIWDNFVCFIQNKRESDWLGSSNCSFSVSVFLEIQSQTPYLKILILTPKYWKTIQKKLLFLVPWIIFF